MMARSRSADRVVVVGGGPNGLVAAARLGAAGREVVLCEAREQLGGLAASEEFHPGYRTAGTLFDTAGVSRKVAEGLGLRGLGLRFRERPTPVFGPEPDGPGILLDQRAPDATELRDDARSYYSFRRYLDRVEGVVRTLVEERAPDLQPEGVGELWGWLRRGWSIRRLGRRDLYELLRVAPMCVADWMRDRFQSERLSTLLAVPALTPGIVGPWAPGTATNLLLNLCLHQPEVQGGAPGLVEVLEKACHAGGVELRCGARVTRVKAREGAVQGVLLASGEEIDAGAVYLATDVRTGLLDLLEPGALPVELEDRVERFRARGSVAVLDLALDGPVDWNGRPGDRFESVRTGQQLDDLERAADALKYGEVAARPFVELRMPSLHRSDLAPTGGHVLTAWVHFAPMDPDGGWTDALRDGLRDATLDSLEDCAPGLRERVVGHRLRTPDQLAEQFGLSGGHLFHGEYALDQLGPLRPNLSCSRTETPVAGLRLCGGSTHPCGGITLLPGWHPSS